MCYHLDTFLRIRWIEDRLLFGIQYKNVNHLFETLENVTKSNKIKKLAPIDANLHEIPTNLLNMEANHIYRVRNETTSIDYNKFQNEKNCNKCQSSENISVLFFSLADSVDPRFENYF